MKKAGMIIVLWTGVVGSNNHVDRCTNIRRGAKINDEDQKNKTKNYEARENIDI